jgi:enoyl-CoA hydratase/carnithine racemase
VHSCCVDGCLHVWLVKRSGVQNLSGSASTVVAQLAHIVTRVATIGAIGVAAINGHAFGGGALLAMAHDMRVMLDATPGPPFPRLCIPALALNILLPAPLVTLVKYVAMQHSSRSLPQAV